MKISIYDWREGGVLFKRHGLSYKQGDSWEADDDNKAKEKMLELVNEFFEAGLNVMICRYEEIVEKKIGGQSIEKEINYGIDIRVDTLRFRNLVK